VTKSLSIDDIPTALDRLIAYYTVTGKPDEVKKWQAVREKDPTR
jgi:hypothetical protein